LQAVPVTLELFEFDEVLLPLELDELPPPLELDEIPPPLGLDKLPPLLELDELPPLLELSSPEGEDGDDSEQAKTIREIAIASVGIVSFIVSTPLVNLLCNGRKMPIS
jgi:hypothetical protein